MYSFVETMTLAAVAVTRLQVVTYIMSLDLPLFTFQKEGFPLLQELPANLITYTGNVNLYLAPLLV